MPREPQFGLVSIPDLRALCTFLPPCAGFRGSSVTRARPRGGPAAAAEKISNSWYPSWGAANGTVPQASLVFSREKESVHTFSWRHTCWAFDERVHVTDNEVMIVVQITSLKRISRVYAFYSLLECVEMSTCANFLQRVLTCCAWFSVNLIGHRPFVRFTSQRNPAHRLVPLHSLLLRLTWILPVFELFFRICTTPSPSFL